MSQAPFNLDPNSPEWVSIKKSNTLVPGAYVSLLSGTAPTEPGEYEIPILFTDNDVTVQQIVKLTVDPVTPTPTASQTPTPSITPTSTPEPPTPTPTTTQTPTQTPTSSVTPTITPTETTTPTPTPTPTETPTPTVTPTITPKPSSTPTPTPTVTPSVTPSVTPTITQSPSVTPTITSTVTETPTQTPTVTPTPSITPTTTPTPTTTYVASVSNIVAPSIVRTSVFSLSSNLGVWNGVPEPTLTYTWSVSGANTNGWSLLSSQVLNVDGSDFNNCNFIFSVTGVNMVNTVIVDTSVFNISVNNTVDIPQLTTWYSTEDSSTYFTDIAGTDVPNNIGDRIARWNDRVSGNFTLTQTTLSSRPTLSRENIYNNYAVSFSSVNQFLNLQNEISNSKGTHFIVYKRNNNCIGLTNTQNNSVFSVWHADDSRLKIKTQSTLTESDIFNNNGINTTAIIFQNGNPAVFNNNVFSETNNIFGEPVLYTSITGYNTFGKLTLNNTEYFSNSDICEYFTTNSVLTNREVIVISNILQSKWNKTIQQTPIALQSISVSRDIQNQDTVIALTGTWLNVNTLSANWQKASLSSPTIWSTIPSASALSYTTTTSDLSSLLRYSVTVSNTFGSTIINSSSIQTIDTPINRTLTVLSAYDSQGYYSLTGSSTWSLVDSVSSSWQASPLTAIPPVWTNVGDLNSSTFILSSESLYRNTIRYSVTGSNLFANTVVNSVTSAPTAPMLTGTLLLTSNSVYFESNSAISIVPAWSNAYYSVTSTWQLADISSPTIWVNLTSTPTTNWIPGSAVNGQIVRANISVANRYYTINSLTDSVLVGGPAYIVSRFPDSVVSCYALFNLSWSATNVVQCVKDTDLTTPVDFTAVSVLSGELINWAGTDTVYVTKLYDQSGNSDDIVYTNVNTAPIIARNGTLITDRFGVPGITCKDNTSCTLSGITTNVQLTSQSQHLFLGLDLLSAVNSYDDYSNTVLPSLSSTDGTVILGRSSFVQAPGSTLSWAMKNGSDWVGSYVTDQLQSGRYIFKLGDDEGAPPVIQWNNTTPTTYIFNNGTFSTIRYPRTYSNINLNKDVVLTSFILFKKYLNRVTDNQYIAPSGTASDLIGNTLNKIKSPTIFIPTRNAENLFINPSVIPGLQLWLDAADSSTLFDATAGGNLVTTNGAAVARWADKSGNNRHAIQGTVNNRPIKSQNSLYFNGSTSFFDSLSGYLLNIGQGASGTFVCMASGSGDSLLSNERTGSAFCNGRFSIESNKLRYVVNTLGAPPYEYSVSPAAAGNANQINFYAASYIAPTNTGTLSGTICTNGAFQTVTNNSYTVANQGTNSSFTTLEIGRYRNFTYFTNYFTGSISKILYYNRNLTQAEITFLYQNL